MAVDRDHAEDADQGRQHQRQPEQPQEERAAGEGGPARQRPRHENGGADAEQGRQQSLPDREGDDPLSIAAVQDAAQLDRPGGAQQACERAADDKAEQQEGERPRYQPADHWLVASTHSSIHCLRWAATSSGANSSDFAGCTIWPNSFGRPPADSLTGYIQLVVGMTSWNAGETMKARNFSARSPCAEPAMRPATSICM